MSELSVTNRTVHAPEMMLAEKWADLILGAQPLPPHDVPLYRHGQEMSPWPAGTPERGGAGTLRSAR